MQRRSSLALLLAGMLCLSQTAFAWGTRAHAVIDRTAVDTLPADGPIFLKNYVDYIAGSASIPDTWRGASDPFSKIEEDPNHGWFREQFAFMKVIPRSRYEFVLALYREQLRIALFQRLTDGPAADKSNNLALLLRYKNIRIGSQDLTPSNGSFLHIEVSQKLIRHDPPIGSPPTLNMHS